MRRRDVERIAAPSGRPADRRAAARPRASDASQVVALADAYAPDAPLLALALEDRPELRDYFTRLRGVQLEIGGADLAELGLAGVAAGGGGPRRAPPAEAQRRARRPRVGARGRARADRGDAAATIVTVASSSEIAERYPRHPGGGRRARDGRRGHEVRVARGHGRPRRGRARGGRREPRAGSRRQARAYGDAFRWHFIGHLQSNKVKVVNPICELVHSLGVGLGRAPAHRPGPRSR